MVEVTESKEASGFQATFTASLWGPGDWNGELEWGVCSEAHGTCMVYLVHPHSYRFSYIKSGKERLPCIFSIIILAQSLGCRLYLTCEGRRLSSRELPTTKFYQQSSRRQT